jgi:hypothetical protein
MHEEGAGWNSALEGSRFNACLKTWRYLALSRVAAGKHESRRLPGITQRDVLAQRLCSFDPPIRR